MKVWKKFVSVFSLILCLAVFLAGNCFAADMEGERAVEPRAFGSLSLPIKRQSPYPNACWAACGASAVQHYKGYTVTMQDFANAAGNSLSNSAKLDVIKRGLSAYGISSSAIQADTPTFSKMVAEIRKGNPIIMRMTNHAVLLNGYDDSTQELAFMDPQVKSNIYTSCTYQELLDGNNPEYMYYCFEYCTMYN